MKTDDTYRTIAQTAEGLFKEKGSKFMAYVFAVNTEDEIKNHILRLKKEHHNARHHCYAYRLGANGEQYRTNDDGEPSGTAGRPIYGQLLSHRLTNILIVVVRYFGGTLLGVGGLINAYKNAAADAINNARIIEKTMERHYRLRFSYSNQNIIMRIIKKYQLEVLNTWYEMDCTIEIAIRLALEEKVISKLKKIEGLQIKKCQQLGI